MITYSTLFLGLAEGGGFNPLAFDPSAMVLTLATFFGLLFLLARFAWGPILQAVEAREKRIEDAIMAAESGRAEAQRMLEDYQSTVANVEAEVAALREKGRAEAETMRRQIKSQAEQEAGEIAEKARREIELAKSQALEDIRRESVAMGLAVASRVVGRSLDGSDQQRIAEEVVGSLSAVEQGGS